MAALLEAPTRLALKRRGTIFTATWAVPSSATAAKSDKKWVATDIVWTLDERGVPAKKDPISCNRNWRVQDKDDFININNVVTRSPRNKKFTRKSFYPVGKIKLNGIVAAVNGTAPYRYGRVARAYYKFALPDPPTIEIGYDDAGTATVTVTTPHPLDTPKECYRTMILVQLKRTDGKTVTLLKWTPTGNAKWVKGFDLSDYMGDMASGKTIVLTAKAYAQGIAGDNPAKKKAVTRSRTFAIPSSTSIKDVTTTAKDGSGRISVYLSPGRNVTRVQLQRRVGEDGSFSDVEGAVDNGKCKVLFDNYGDAAPAYGEYVYYRVEATRDNFKSYSKPFRADKLYTATPTLASTKIGFVGDPVPSADGTSVKVVIGWTESKPASGTELSWSTDPNAWESTVAPSIYECTWEDKQKQSQDWGKTQTVYIQGLKESETYYIQARRYTDGEVRVFSEYSQRIDVEPVVGATEVSLSADAYIRRGEPITATWTFSGGATQRAWAIHPEGSPSVSIASGTDSMGVGVIDPDRYGDAEELAFYVSVSTGGTFTDSNTFRTTIASAPECEIACAETCTAQPFSFEAYSSSGNASLSYRVASMGTTKDEPDGGRDQLMGDVVAAGTVTPAWEETQWSETEMYASVQRSIAEAEAEVAEAEEAIEGLEPGDEGYEEALANLENAQATLADAEAKLASLDGTTLAATIQIVGDGTIDLVDECEYDIEAFSTDLESGLSSPEAKATFAVLWAHQAPKPSEDITLEVDEEARTVEVTLLEPEGFVEGDVYDLYRGTASGFVPIRMNLPVDAVVTDRFAAFGEQAYRVCTRTPDGDLAWLDYGYELPSDSMRFDWADGYSESVHNLRLNDSYKKDFARTEHVDGSVGGGWNRAVSREGSYSTTAIKGMEDTNLVALASHPGAAFCRTPEGYAFECNVDVSRSTDHTSMLEEFSLSLSEVTLSDAFKPTDDDIEDE